MAEDADVDLVEVAPNATPPVCRLMDYGKFRYQEQKKAQEAKAKQKVVQVKEVKFRPATDENDFQTKLRSLVRFLGDGDIQKNTISNTSSRLWLQSKAIRSIKTSVYILWPMMAN